MEQLLLQNTYDLKAIYNGKCDPKKAPVPAEKGSSGRLRLLQPWFEDQTWKICFILGTSGSA